MKTVGEFKKAGLQFVEGDVCVENSITYSDDWFKFTNRGYDWFYGFDLKSFAWRDLTTKPDNPQYKIELDIDNHRWRPSLNQDDNLLIAPPEFKVGDLVVADCDAAGKYLIEIKYLDSHSVFGYLQSNDGQPPTLNHFCAYISNIKLTHHNPKLDELKDIIGTHDDPTECAKAILAAGYTK